MKYKDKLPLMKERYKTNSISGINLMQDAIADLHKRIEILEKNEKEILKKIHELNVNILMRGRKK